MSSCNTFMCLSVINKILRYCIFNIEQSYSCTIRYFNRPDSFCELVTWPTKISDNTLAFLFNKCNLISTFSICSLCNIGLENTVSIII